MRKSERQELSCAVDHCYSHFHRLHVRLIRQREECVCMSVRVCVYMCVRVCVCIHDIPGKGKCIVHRVRFIFSLRVGNFEL
jgi:hypothetical protein